MRSIKPYALSILLILFPGFFLWAQAPEKVENMVYSIGAFDGKDYTGTFCREEADTIYLIANESNFINIRKTLIYFWPITQEWKADYDTLNENFLNGKIELTDSSGKKQMLEPVKYTYYNFPGEYEINWKVFTGDAADEEYAKYEKMMDDYWAALDKYHEKQLQLEILFNKLIEEIGKRREAGRDISELVEEAQRYAEQGAGDPPERPGYYVRPVEKAFHFDLPPGEYRIRFVLESGEVMEGSDKKMILHKNRRENGIGYDVIPADKWTRPEVSQTPSAVLYVDGTTDLFLRPFYQDEFNDLFYNKTVRNDSKGNPELMKWVKIQQVPKPRVEMILPKNRTESIEEKPYYVEQLKGSALGYKIVPFDPEGRHKDREPSLWAYYIPMGKDASVVKLKLQDKAGEYLSSGERQIRIVFKSGALLVSLILAFIPVGIMIVVLVLRARRYV
jgi:hypothetical protein